MNKNNVALAAILLLALIAFGPGVYGTFVLDDYVMHTVGATTRPLTWLTFGPGGDSAGIHHAINIALHLASVVVASRVMPIPPLALFALHPAMAESVNYIWARSTLLMTFFCLLAWWAWTRQRSWLAVLLFGLALLCKIECAAFPVVLFLTRREWKPLTAMLMLAFIAGGGVAWIASTTPGSQAGLQAEYTSLEYLSAQGSAILRYLRLYVLPYGFSIDPSVTPSWWAWLAVIALAAIWRNAWFLCALLLFLPASSIFPADDLVADRRIYLPAVALAMAVARHIPKRALWPLAVVLAFLSLHRTLVWIHPERLWAEAVQSSPDKVRPRIWLARLSNADAAREHLNAAEKIATDDPLVASELGRVELAAGRPAVALQHFGRALALAPDNAQAVANRGVALLLLGQRDAAKADFERALRMDPCSFEARHNLLQAGFEVPKAPENCVFEQK